MAYKAPIWEDGKSPAISAENLNNLSQAAEGAQVLYGNSVPTSSTEGAVGQFYLVVVADSDGSYPLYQCVAIANGHYVWRDTRRIPDSITSMLGIPAPGTINSALNVLANVGNLHVWMKTVVRKEPVPAGYTLGAETNTKLCYMYYTEGMSVSYASSVSIDDAGNVSLVSPASISLNTPGDTLVNEVAITKGKFVKFTATNSSNIATPGVYFIPTDATFTYVTSGTSANQGLYCDKAQKVNPYPLIPAGTTTDYLTSTNRNAYPDKSAEGGEPEKPAHYTLGEAETVDVLSSAADYSAMVYVCDLNSIIINNDGSINTTNFSTLMGGSNSLTMAGNWTKFSTTKAYYITSGSDNVVFTDTVFTVSEENTLTYSGGKYILQGCRKLIGHAKVEAIPANTTITYLGQLGGGARIEVGSYVGTGTQGSANPTSLTFNFVPKMVIVTKQGQYGFALDGTFSSYSLFWIPGITYFNPGGSGSSSYADAQKNKITLSGKTLSWYRDSTSSNGNASHQLNESGKTYQWVALG